MSKTKSASAKRSLARKPLSYQDLHDLRQEIVDGLRSIGLHEEEDRGDMTFSIQGTLDMVNVNNEPSNELFILLFVQQVKDWGGDNIHYTFALNGTIELFVAGKPQQAFPNAESAIKHFRTALLKELRFVAIEAQRVATQAGHQSWRYAT